MSAQDNLLTRRVHFSIYLILLPFVSLPLIPLLSFHTPFFFAQSPLCLSCSHSILHFISIVSFFCFKSVLPHFFFLWFSSTLTHSYHLFLSHSLSPSVSPFHFILLSLVYGSLHHSLFLCLYLFFCANPPTFFCCIPHIIHSLKSISLISLSPQLKREKFLERKKTNSSTFFLITPGSFFATSNEKTWKRKDQVVL